MGEWISGIIASLGYPGIVLLLFLENVVPPIPSEVIMPLAGFLTREGEMVFAGVVAAGACGSLLGCLPWYWLGAALGEERVRGLVRRHGKWLMMEEEDLDRAMRWFERHGMMAVLLGRLVPGVRSYISLPAGLARMPLGRFLACSAVGIVGWTGVLAWIGRLLGRDHENAARYIGWFTYAVVGALLASWLWWGLRRWLRRRAARGQGGATSTGGAQAPGAEEETTSRKP